MLSHRYLSAVLALYLILGSWKGYLALFEEGKEEPRQFFPVPVDSLPEADRKALEAGIVIRGEKKLQQLLEDFCS